MNYKKAFGISLLIMPIFLGIIFSIHYFVVLSLPWGGEATTFTIKSGEGFSSINYRLYKKGFISSPRAFHYYTKLTGNMENFKAGDYEVTSDMSAFEMIDKFTSGSAILNSVTIPEGKNMFEIGKILEANDITSYEDFVATCRDKEVIASLGIDAPSVEGYLFPETYNFAPNTQARTVVNKMISQFQSVVSDIDFSHPFLNKHQVIILASIVEKETGAKFERPTIAGVYTNRLKKKMRLQADPTTIYGIYENFDGNLRKKHLLQKTPYNTYKISGLPLGPIANPSLAAIKASLAPQKHNYLYFVSKNDGTHVFTPTYKEHQKAVRYWQLNRKRREGKSWRDLEQ
jgi:UPF0755 protein